MYHVKVINRGVCTCSVLKMMNTYEVQLMNKMFRMLRVIVVNFKRIKERNSVTRFFVSKFFHQTTSPGPKRHAQEQLRIFSNISGVISIRNRIPGDEYTGKSIEIS
jgi:hypothetical protein